MSFKKMIMIIRSPKNANKARQIGRLIIFYNADQDDRKGLRTEYERYV